MIGLGRAYAAEFHNVALTNAGGDQDLFYIKPAASGVVGLEALYLSNVGGTADAGDAQEELVRLEIIKLPAVVTAGTGGGAQSPAPAPLIGNDRAADSTVRINDTGVATTTGTSVNLHSDGWNVRIPYVWLPPPEHRPQIWFPHAVVVRLNSTLADDITCNATCIFREIS